LKSAKLSTFSGYTEGGAMRIAAAFSFFIAACFDAAEIRTDEEIARRAERETRSRWME